MRTKIYHAKRPGIWEFQDEHGYYSWVVDGVIQPPTLNQKNGL